MASNRDLWMVSHDGKTIPRWRMAAILKIAISPYIGEKSSDFDDILYTAADFELDECHVIKNEKVALDSLRVRQKAFLVYLTLVVENYCISMHCGNSVLSVYSLSLLADIQRLTSTMHSLSRVAGVVMSSRQQCRYNCVSSANEYYYYYCYCYCYCYCRYLLLLLRTTTTIGYKEIWGTVAP